MAFRPTFSPAKFTILSFISENILQRLILRTEKYWQLGQDYRSNTLGILMLQPRLRRIIAIIPSGKTQVIPSVGRLTAKPPRVKSTIIPLNLTELWLNILKNLISGKLVC